MSRLTRRPRPIIAAVGAAVMMSAGVCRAAAMPVVAVVALNAGTETTDFLVPYGVLATSGAVDIHAVSITAGPVALHPALTVELDETIASFDAAHPAGADVVIVPAVHDPADAQLLGWLQHQARAGAGIVAICDGVWPVAAAGLLDGKRATGHWYSLDRLQSTYPSTTWLRDRRYVRDGTVMTTTGVTASIPASLALVEQFAGRDTAQAVAGRLGVREWGDAHDSTEFSLTPRDMMAAARNWLGFWRYERVGIPVANGMDEIALALSADAWARTYRTRVLAVAPSPGLVRLRDGIALVPDAVETAGAVDRLEPAPSAGEAPTAALDRTLTSIERAHGAATADFVALQLEYPERRLHPQPNVEGRASARP